MNGQRLTSEQAARLLAHATAAQVHPPAAARGDHIFQTDPVAAEVRKIAGVSAPGGQAFEFEEHQDGSGI